MGIPITFVDLFSGAGGFSLGLQQAGFTFKNHYYSEIDASAIGVYNYRFKSAIPLGNIEKIKPSQIKEKIDLLTFGFPCQDLSAAGKQKGLRKGKRSRLFFEALRLIKTWKPRVFVFENVRGLFSVENGRAFETILQEIANLGLYECQWQLLNTSWFLPQNRERIYFVATLRKEPFTEIFPLPESYPLHQKSHSKTSKSKDSISTIKASYSKGVHAGGETYIGKSKVNWENELKKISSAVKIQSEKLSKSIGWIPIKRVRSEKGKKIRSNNLKAGNDYNPFSEKDYAFRNRDIIGTLTGVANDPENLLAGYVQYDPKANGYCSQAYRVYHISGHAPALIRSHNGTQIFDNLRIRRFTPLECERLQGFPDHWTLNGLSQKKQIQISDTQRYKLMGNAVSVPVVRAVGIQLKKHFKRK